MLETAWKARFRIAGLGIPGAVARLEETLRRQPGVLRVRAEPTPAAATPAWAGIVTVVYKAGQTSPASLAAALAAAGFTQVEVL